MQNIKSNVETDFYDNGQVRLMISYRDNKLDGPSKGWYQDGSLSFTGNWQKDRKHDEWVHYDSQGNVLHQQWNDGKIVSPKI